MSSTTTYPLDQILAAECGDRIPSIEGGSLIVVRRHDIVDGRAQEVVAPTDGRNADLSAWHTGSSDPEAEVYYERICADGSGSHGWVDGTSRQIVQAG